MRWGATLGAACTAHLRMTVSSWSSDGFVKMGASVDTSQEYEPEASKSMFLSRICRSLLSFHCKTKQTWMERKDIIRSTRTVPQQHVSFIWNSKRRRSVPLHTTGLNIITINILPKVHIRLSYFWKWQWHVVTSHKHDRHPLCDIKDGSTPCSGKRS